MEGRWRLHYVDEYRDQESIVIGPALESQEGVPVVPCDDEAIERVARRIAGRESGDFSDEYWDGNPKEHPVWIETACDYLRAAGETP